jgi:arylsulfatase A-like enzyme
VPQLDHQRAHLVALIEHLDDSIGRLRETLKANGHEQNTLVIFTSDNGGQLSAGASNGPWRGGKSQFYDGGIRVPFVAYWPGQIPAGSASEETALIMDIFPTVCAAAQTTAGEIDGVSLLPLLRHASPTALPERSLFWVRREGGAPYYGRDYYAVRRGPWKLVQNNPFEPFKLFNLLEDSHEDRDLSSVNRKIYDELTSALQAHLQKAGAIPWQK